MERALRILANRARCSDFASAELDEVEVLGQGEVFGDVQEEVEEVEGEEPQGGDGALRLEEEQAVKGECPDGVLRLGEHAPNVEDDTLQGVDIGDGWLRSPPNSSWTGACAQEKLRYQNRGSRNRWLGRFKGVHLASAERIAGLARAIHVISGTVDLW